MTVFLITKERFKSKDTMKPNFSEILKHLIETSLKSDGTKYSVEEIGVGIGCSSSHIRKLLNGQSNPGYEVIEKLALFFGVDPNFLHGWKPVTLGDEIKEIEDRLTFYKAHQAVKPGLGNLLRKIADMLDQET